MIIRNMVEKDLPRLSELYEQFWNEKTDIAILKSQFQKLKNNDTHILLSAVENDNLTGSVMGVVCEELYGECKPFLVIENMIVDKNCRRAGVGKALLAELENQAREKGCTQIILVTEKDRKDACCFYESAGFESDRNTGYKKKI